MLPVVAYEVAQLLIGAGALKAGGKAYEGITSYLASSSNKGLLESAIKNTYPTKTSLSRLGTKSRFTNKSLQKQKRISDKKSDHLNLAEGVVASVALGLGLLGTTASDSLTKVSESSADTKAVNDALKEAVPASPLMQNQINMKQSIDYLIDSINSQTIVQFHGMSSISLQLEALVSSVHALTDAILSQGEINNLPEYEGETDISLPVSSPDYSEYLERIASHADVAKLHAEFLTSPVSLTDLDGNVLAETSPMAMEAIKNASLAREKTDINNQEFDDSDFMPSVGLPVLPFVGRGDIFNPDFQDSGNPFILKTVGN